MVVPMRLIVGPQTSAAFTTKASCSLLLMTGWPSCWSGRSCHKKRPVAAAVKTGMFSRRLQLAPGLEPPTSWSSSPVTTPNIYGRAESLKSPGLGGDLCEDRKIYGRSSVSHPVRCPRHGGAQLGGGALLHSRTVGWHARGSLRLLRYQAGDGVHALLSRFLHIGQRFLCVHALLRRHPTYSRLPR
jgi:hypothetical protein